MEEEKHKCKLCVKNGRALGCHMSSHNIGLHPHPDSASSSMEDPAGFVLHDTESETESSKKATPIRSRLNPRRSIYVALPSQELSESCTEQEPMSSVSDAATAEEDVALSLMLLSRDRWDKEKEESDERWKKKKKKKWFECESCEKVFKSYQGLGGHRASHKKKRSLRDEVDHQGSEELEKKSKSSLHHGHECPICFKVFSSGQALGGHKRSHASAKESTKRRIISLIDLNLPAPWEEEDLVSSVFKA